MTSKIKHILLVTFLLLTIILGAYFRLTGTNWDQNSHLHPDERFLTMVIMKMETPNSFSNYMDEKTSTYNPRNQKDTWYVYGTLPPIILHTLARITHQFSYDEITQLGRKLSSLFDLITLLLLFALAQVIWRSLAISTLASFCYATCPLSIQHAHFFIVDIYLTTFLTASLLALILWQKKEQRRYLTLSALFFSLALASKITALFFAPMILALLIYKLYTQKDKRKKYTLQTAYTGVIAYLTLRLSAADMFLSPLIFDPRLAPRFLESLHQLKGYEDSLHFPPILQWIARTPLLYPLEQLASWGMGWPLFLSTLLGTAIALKYATHKTTRHHALLPILLIGWLLLTGTRTLMAQRYFLPILPPACALAGWSLFKCWTLHGSLRATGKIITVLTLTAMLLYSVLFTSIYRKPHSRTRASDWLMQHVQPHETILCEYWDDALPLRARHPNQPQPTINMMPVFDLDTPEKQNTMIQQMNDAEWIVLSSSRAWGTVTRAPARFPMMLKYYPALFNGTLGYHHTATFTSFPQLGKLTLLDHQAEEAFHVFDHPIVLIFKKTKAYHPNKARRLLTPKKWGNPSEHIKDAGNPLPPLNIRPLLNPKSNG